MEARGCPSPEPKLGKKKKKREKRRTELPLGKVLVTTGQEGASQPGNRPPTGPYLAIDTHEMTRKKKDRAM